MENHDASPITGRSAENNTNPLGFYSAIFTSAVTLITFGISILTPPLSGPFCSGPCFEYPYTDVIARFPRDYLWMYPAMLLMLLFVALLVCIHHYAPERKRIFSQLGLVFGVIAAAILLIDYFVQISVIQPSLVNGETDGIPLLTQYNPHGVFIALEEVGYLLMSVALFSTAMVFSGNKLENAIRWSLLIGFILTICSLIIISVVYGIHREYRFEVAVITINWIVLIITGILLSVLFKRTLAPS